MKRIVSLLAVMAAAPVFSSEVALAVTKHCKIGMVCYVTRYCDTLHGTVGDKVIHGKGSGRYLEGL